MEKDMKLPARKKLPIGIRDFEEIIKNGYAYVDKTGFIPEVLTCKYSFISRPRRFGKSLFLSMLRTFFEGRRELFKGLAIDRADVDWTPSPVLYFDLSGVANDADSLFDILDRILAGYEAKYGFERGEKRTKEIGFRFGRLLEKIHEKTGRRVVVLIDEYDRALSGIERGDDVYAANFRMLDRLYCNMKSGDRHIQMAVIIGVGRFANIGPVSGYNNFIDVSLHDEFSTLFGFTEPEVRTLMEQADTTESEATTTTLSYVDLHDYYYGYRFCEEADGVYNPYSVLRALSENRISPYWYDEDYTPWVKEVFAKRREEDIQVSRVKSYELELGEEISWKGSDSHLYQLGYLTIDYYDKRRRKYCLGIPNREISEALLG